MKLTLGILDNFQSEKKSIKLFAKQRNPLRDKYSNSKFFLCKKDSEKCHSSNKLKLKIINLKPSLIGKRHALTTEENSENEKIDKKVTKFILLGDLGKFLSTSLPRKKCLNPKSCSFLNKIHCYFYDVWLNSFKNKTPEMVNFTFFKTFSTVNKEQIEQKLKNLFSDSFQIKSDSSIERFLLSPKVFLRNASFLTLTWPERIIALLFLVKKNSFLAPPSCYCSKTVLTFLKKNSTKRKHELIRFCIKKYVTFLIEKCLSKTVKNKSNSFKKKMFYQMINESIPGTSSNNLVKSYFNEDSKKTMRKRQRLKNIEELIMKFNMNPITFPHFNKNVLDVNFFKIYQKYYPERRIKVSKLLKRFNNKSLFEIFQNCESLLNNQRFKLFFGHEDILAGYELIKGMIGT